MKFIYIILFHSPLIFLLTLSSAFIQNVQISKQSCLTKCFMGKYTYDQLYPRSKNQLEYYNALGNLQNRIVIGIGPAGTGKTLFACQTALEDLKTKQIKKIVITRPLISVEREDIGFLPGTMNDKMDPWTKPILDILCELLNKETVEKMVMSGVIELSPLAYMRGRTFKDTFIIADEMQNSSPQQMQMLTTRIGYGSKLVINGDLQQSDYRRRTENGLQDLLNRIYMYRGDVESHIPSHQQASSDIQIVHMNDTDIQRSPIVSTILSIYDYIPINRDEISPSHYPSYRDDTMDDPKD